MAIKIWTPTLIINYHELFFQNDKQEGDGRPSHSRKHLSEVRDIYPESALLESSDFHGNENSLSFIALRPLASIGINNGECTATFPDETREVTPLTEDYNVPEAMNAFLGRFKVEGADKKVCGLFGYTAFDASVISRTSRSWKFITRKTTPRYAIHII